jgi:rRNA maturation endonuclease Nob1
MICLVCKDCKKIWFTANTDENQRCDFCGGELEEIDVNEAEKDNDKKIG